MISLFNGALVSTKNRSISINSDLLNGEPASYRFQQHNTGAFSEGCKRDVEISRNVNIAFLESSNPRSPPSFLPSTFFGVPHEPCGVIDEMGPGAPPFQLESATIKSMGGQTSEDYLRSQFVLRSRGPPGSSRARVMVPSAAQSPLIVNE